jgi:hypothetical protein
VWVTSDHSTVSVVADPVLGARLTALWANVNAMLTSLAVRQRVVVMRAAPACSTTTHSVRVSATSSRSRSRSLSVLRHTRSPRRLRCAAAQEDSAPEPSDDEAGADVPAPVEPELDGAPTSWDRCPQPLVVWCIGQTNTCGFVTCDGCTHYLTLPCSLRRSGTCISTPCPHSSSLVRVSARYSQGRVRLFTAHVLLCDYRTLRTVNVVR